ncbi:MAG: hypothetical protein E6R04_08440, partial [Spirochaetes bacterium]
MALQSNVAELPPGTRVVAGAAAAALLVTMGVAPIASSALATSHSTHAFTLTAGDAPIDGGTDTGTDAGGYDLSQITDAFQLLLTHPSEAINSIDGLAQFFPPNLLALMDLLAVGNISETLSDPQALLDSMSALFTGNLDGWFAPILSGLTGGEDGEGGFGNILQLLDPLGLLSGEGSLGDLFGEGGLGALLDPLGLLSGEGGLDGLLDGLNLDNIFGEGGLDGLLDGLNLDNIFGEGDLGALLDPLGLLSGEGGLADLFGGTGDLSSIFDGSWLTDLFGGTGGLDSILDGSWLTDLFGGLGGLDGLL